jgi:glycosyltransferase involved in cell wall biosynthesis
LYLGNNLCAFDVSLISMPAKLRVFEKRLPKELPRLCFITSNPLSVLVFLVPHLKTMMHDFDLRVLANGDKNDLLRDVGLDIPIESIGIVREINLVKDLKAILQLCILLSASHPHAVHTLTPKAGLIGMFAAWLLRVPVRVHTFTGQVWATRTGFMRRLLKSADKCIAILSTDIFVDSPSQREFLIAEGVIKRCNSSVLALGSICGVDVKRFCANEYVRQKVRTEMGALDKSLVCLYLGRLNRDKGVLDLAVAFSRVVLRHPEAELWVIGPDEANFFNQMMSLLVGVEHKVKRVGYTKVPEQYMQAADVFCMPSYREGFGSSVIEAAACGLPALTSRIYGLTDAVIEGQTGWMHVPGNADDLSQRLDQILSNPVDIKVMGQRAQSHAKEFFSEELVTSAMLNFYKTKFADVS